MSRLARLAAAPALALTALLTACGGGDGKVTGPGAGEVIGSFSGNVSGGLTRSLSGGFAVYGQSRAQEETGFALGMGTYKADKSTQDVIVVGRDKRDLPAAGTYTLHNPGSETEARPEDFVLMAVFEAGSATNPMVCIGTGGTLTIQSTSGSRMKGSYTAQADCVGNTEQTTTVTLTGTFDAIEGTRMNLPGSASARIGELRARAH